MTPVLTITPNPALDQTIHVPTLQPGHVHLATATHTAAGGKGVNVAACLADWGTPVVAGGLLGQDNAGAFEALLGAKGVADHFVRLAGRTRTNIKLVAADTGDTTDINLPGFDVPHGAWDALLARVRPLAQAGSWVVAAGSLPPALAAGGYGPLLRMLDDAGATTVLDTSGAALAAALAPGQPMPAVIKPNRHELEMLAGKKLPTTADVVREAQALLARGVGAVVVSLGSEGALMVRPGGVWRAAPLAVTPVSSVGAGDALVAGLVAALHAGQSWPQALRLGVAFASAKLRQLGPHLPPRDTVHALADEVVIDEWTGDAA